MHKTIVIVRDVLSCVTLLLTSIILALVLVTGAQLVNAFRQPAAGTPVPATCYVGDSRPECEPGVGPS